MYSKESRSYSSPHVKRNVISKSMHLAQITRDVDVSKNLPSPKVNFASRNDWTHLLICFDSFILFSELSSSTDLMNGLDIILKSRTITKNMLTATAANRSKSGRGTTDLDAITMYNVKLSRVVTHPTNADMTGCFRTRLCISTNNSKMRYFLKHEETCGPPVFKSL